MINRKLKKGDVIAVRATVRHNPDRDDAYLHINVGNRRGLGSSAAVDLSDVVSLIHPKIDEGDRVRRGEVSGVVRHIHEAEDGAVALLVEVGPGDFCAWVAGDDLEVIEDEPALAVAAPPSPAA